MTSPYHSSCASHYIRSVRSRARRYVNVAVAAFNTAFVTAGVQEKLGIMNSGVVYAVFGYEAHNQDELTFDDGDRIVVLRKGDDTEREWWWSRIDDREGYVPRNLLGVSNEPKLVVAVGITRTSVEIHVL